MITSIFRIWLMRVWQENKYNKEFVLTGKSKYLVNKAIQEGYIQIVRLQEKGLRIFEKTRKYYDEYRHE